MECVDDWGWTRGVFYGGREGCSGEVGVGTNSRGTLCEYGNVSSGADREAV